MPGILPMKVIKVGTSAQARIAQACDRCRSKKIRCDGFRPCCSQCANVGFECKTSDKLSRRAFPRGYTESLEERVRALESEVRELKDLLDAKDDKIDMLSRIHSNSPAGSRRSSANQSARDAQQARSSLQDAIDDSPTLVTHQSPALHTAHGHDPFFAGTSSAHTLVATLKRRIQESGRPCPELIVDSLLPPLPSPNAAKHTFPVGGSWKCPPRLVSDQMVNIFFQEWAPLFPTLHRPTFLALYEKFVTDPHKITDKSSMVQLNLVFSIAALSNKTRLSFDMTPCEKQVLAVLDAVVRDNTLATLQCLLLAQIYCLQKGDYARLPQYRSLAVGIAHRLGLHQSQKRFAFGNLTCETRKRVFWTLYTLDCFSAALLGAPKLLNDTDIQCEYPVDVDDEYISEQGIQPSLPGESTKFSSALALFRVSRILSKTLTELYPATSSHEVSLRKVGALADELDQWSNSLPSHLSMAFAQDKPAVHVISSRSPFMALTYHYLRTLIHRPAVCALNGDQASASLLALASSSKHTIQILQLLEERNLSFSYCLNKNELLVVSGCSLLLQTLDLDNGSKLMKDSQRMVCSVIEMLDRYAAPSAPAFRKFGCAMISVRRPPASEGSPQTQPSPSPTIVSSPDSTTGSRTELQNMAMRYTMISNANKAAKDARRNTVTASTPPTAGDASKRFRPLAPSTVRKASIDTNIKKSPSSTSSPMSPTRQPSNTARAASSDTRLNLDYFRFPSDPSPPTPSERPGGTPSIQAGDWEQILASLSEQQLNIGTLGPGPIPTASTPGKWPAEGDSVVNEGDWLSPEAWETLDIPASAPSETKPQSLLSFSEESLTSGEDFSSIDFGSAEGECASLSGIVMTHMTPEESTALMPVEEHV